MNWLARFRKQDGRYFFDRKTNIILIVVLVGGYLASRIGPPFVDNYELEKAMLTTVERAKRASTDGHLVESLMRRLKVAGLYQFEQQDFVVQRSHGRITITTEYEVFVNLGMGKGFNLDFSARASGFGK